MARIHDERAALGKSDPRGRVPMAGGVPALVAGMARLLRQLIASGAHK